MLLRWARTYGERFTQLVKMQVTLNKAWRDSKDWTPRNELPQEPKIELFQASALPEIV